MEEWRDVDGYGGAYQVSSEGLVRSVDRVFRDSKGRNSKRAGLILSGNVSKDGYRVVKLSLLDVQKTFRVHSLVAAAFLGERPLGMEVCHNDGLKENNSVSNLRYDTHLENMRDNVRHSKNFWASKSHCKSGHSFSEQSVRVKKKAAGGFQRVCVLCQKMHYAFRRDSRLNPQEKLALDPKWAARI